MTCSIIATKASRVWRRLTQGAAVAAVAVACFSGSSARAQPDAVTDEIKNVRQMLLADSVPSTDMSKQEKIDQAITRFKNQDFAAARSFLNDAKKDNPQLPPSRVLMAKLLMIVNQGQAALGELEEAVISDPSDPEAYMIMGDILFQQGRIAAAHQLFNKGGNLTLKEEGSNPLGATRKQSLTIRTYGGLAAVAEAQRRWKDAQSMLEKWIEIDPKSAAAQLRLGRVIFKIEDAKEAGKPELALAAFKEAKRLSDAPSADPKVAANKVADPNINLGQLYLEKGVSGRAKALENFTIAVTNNPKDKDPDVLIAAANGAMQAKDLDKAAKWATAGLNLKSDSPQGKFTKAMIARLRGDFVEAKKLLDELNRSAPLEFAYSNQLALVLAESKEQSDREVALQHAKLNAERLPKNGEALITGAWCLYRVGTPEAKQQALQILNEVVRQAQQLTPDGAYYVAVMLHEAGKENDAKRWLDQAIKSDSPFFAHEKDAKELLPKIKPEAEKTGG